MIRDHKFQLNKNIDRNNYRFGRHPLKPLHDASSILREQMTAVLCEYEICADGRHPSLQTIANKLNLTPVKVRKLLITADRVNERFSRYLADGLDRSQAIIAVMSDLQLSRASVLSYMPYSKVVYFLASTEPEKISVGAERIRRMWERKKAIEVLKKDFSEENLWKCVVLHQNYPFFTATGLAFRYKLKKGRNDEVTKELWVERGGGSKSLTWSSIMLAFKRIR